MVSTPVLFASVSLIFVNVVSSVPVVMLPRRVVEGFSDPWWLICAVPSE